MDRSPLQPLPHQAARCDVKALQVELHEAQRASQTSSSQAEAATRRATRAEEVLHTSSMSSMYLVYWCTIRSV